MHIIAKWLYFHLISVSNHSIQYEVKYDQSKQSGTVGEMVGGDRERVVVNGSLYALGYHMFNDSYAS